MLRKTMMALVAVATLLVAAPSEAGGFRSRTVVRTNGFGVNRRTVVVNNFGGGFVTPTFVQTANPFFAPTFVQPTFVPVQPNVFVPFGFNGGFQVNAFGGGFCH